MRLTNILLITCLAFHIKAQNIYVNGAKAANGDGSSWATAYNNLQSALDDPNNTTKPIWVAKGTYIPTKDSTGNEIPADNRSKTFFINKNLKLIGGFIGNETMQSQANPTINPTILSGDLGTLNDISDNAIHVLFYTANTNNITSSSELSGFTVTKGNANLSGAAPNLYRNAGGGIFFNAVGMGKILSPTISNCSFLNNNAQTGGACYFNILGSTVTPKYNHCVFQNNTATGAGGAVRFDIRGTNTGTFEGCIFESNTAGSGGAIYNICYSGSSNISVNGTYFIKNSASSGGVIYSCSNGTTVINKPVFTNSAFAENTGINVGGCIYNIANQGETSSEAINCTFTKNSSPNGAAMYSRKAATAVCNPIIKNSIIWDATTANNEVTNNPTALSASTLTNCIVLGVTPMPSNGNTFINCIEANPLFVNIDNLKGTDGLYRTTDDGLNIQSTSPAVDAGLTISLNTSSKSKVRSSTDITGINNRIVGTMIDLGAFEFFVAAPLPLKLLSFNVNNSENTNILTWETSEEVSTDRFEIERSNDAKKYVKIESIGAKGNTEKAEYQYIDENIVVEVKNNQTNIWPNPVANTTWLSVNKELINTNATIYDERGNVLREILISDKNINFDLNLFAQGIYLLKLADGKVLKLYKN